MKNSILKSIQLCLLAALVFLSACHSRTIKGSGNVSSETRQVSGFTSLDVSSALKVVYTEGPEFSLKVVADDNLIPYITTEIHGTELRIGIQERKNFKKVTKAEIHVTAPVVTGVTASGASVFEAVNTLHAGDFSLRLSGASSAFFTAEMTSLKGDLSGASTASIKGTSSSVNWEASGASIYHAAEWSTDQASVNFSGASSASVQVKNSIVATLSGASILNYYGNPTVNSNISGGSAINKK